MSFDNEGAWGRHPTLVGRGSHGPARRPSRRLWRRRYSGGSPDPGNPPLCCPTRTIPPLLAAIPEEVLSRDYGCGDRPAPAAGRDRPRPWFRQRQACFLAAQVVRAGRGRVIGVDMTTSARPPPAPRPQGRASHRVRQRDLPQGQDPGPPLDRDWLDAELRAPARPRPTPISSACEGLIHRGSGPSGPLIPDGEVTSWSELCPNLVHPEDRSDSGRDPPVLRRGGRAFISDIGAGGRPVHLQRDGELWSGLRRGGHPLDLFLAAFEAVGFYGMTCSTRRSAWRTVRGDRSSGA